MPLIATAECGGIVATDRAGDQFVAGLNMLRAQLLLAQLFVDFQLGRVMTTARNTITPKSDAMIPNCHKGLQSLNSNFPPTQEDM